MTRTPPPTRLLDPREEEVVARLHRYATAGTPPMSLDTGDVISAAHRRTTARRARGAGVGTLTVVALALGGTHLAGLEHTTDETPAVPGDVRVVTVANGVTAVTLPARVRGETNAVDLGLEFPDAPTGRPITLSSQFGTLYVDVPLDPGENAAGATSHEVRLEPWSDPDATPGATFRAVTSVDGHEVLVVGTVPQWVGDPVVELVSAADPGFVLPAGGAVDRVELPTFDAPGDGTGRVFAAVVSAQSELSTGSLRLDGVPLVPLVTGSDGTEVVGGVCAGTAEQRTCLRDALGGTAREADVATVQVARGVTATSRLGVAPAPDADGPTLRYDLGLDLGEEDASGRLVLGVGEGASAPTAPTFPVPVGIEYAGELPESGWTTALGGSRANADVDAVSTWTAYSAVGSVWLLTGTVPGSVDPDALARIELSAPVQRADGSRGTSIDVPTFDPVIGDGRRTYVVVVDPAAGLPAPGSGQSPLAPVPTTFVLPPR